MKKRLSLFICVLLISCSADPTSTTETETVTDIDGNIYQTIKIGNQLWMAENLKVTHYQNGDSIPHISSSSVWQNLESGGRCSYNNEVDSVQRSGLLYNWYAVADNRNMAPAGWHMPSDAEWQTLVDFLGGGSVAGLKTKTTSGWNDDGNGSNSSGFSALPVGFRTGSGSYSDHGFSARFWSSTASDSIRGWHLRLSYDSNALELRSGGRKGGYAVRCVRD